MGAVHGWLALLTGGSLAVMAALAAAAAVTGRRPSRLVLDRVMLITLGAVALAALSGLTVAIGVRPVRDPLHLLYAVAIPVALIAGRGIAGRGARSRWWLTAAAIVALLLAVRASLTGG
jgi:hypothetical protein